MREKAEAAEKDEEVVTAGAAGIIKLCHGMGLVLQYPSVSSLHTVLLYYHNECKQINQSKYTHNVDIQYRYIKRYTWRKNKQPCLERHMLAVNKTRFGTQIDLIEINAYYKGLTIQLFDIYSFFIRLN